MQESINHDNKKTAVASKEEGNILFKGGNYEEAAKKYREAIELDPTNPIFFSNYCNALKKLGRFEDMEVAARSCIDLDMKYIKGHYWLAISYLARRMDSDALKACENALDIDPNQKTIEDMYRVLQNSKNDSMSQLMKSCNLIPSKDSLGNTILVSEELCSEKFHTSDGCLDLGKILNAPRRGTCANPDCEMKRSSNSSKLMRCSRCWQVDYCSRECQKIDWKRHKSECNVYKRNVEKRGNMSWQAIVYEGRAAMKKKNFNEAIQKFMAVVESHAMHALFPLIASSHLKNGNVSKAMRYAYMACQSAHGDLQSLVIKARCHMKVNEVESAYLCAYSAYNSRVNEMLRYQGDTKIEDSTLIPLIKELTMTMVSHLKRKYAFTESSFPMKIRISSVPFTFDYKNGQVRIIQDELGSGLHVCKPRIGSPSVPTMQQHTSVTFGSKSILFGGINASNDITNEVRVFDIDKKNTYLCKVQTCTGEVPHPIQGHSACVVSEKMYVFGGAPSLGDLYELDLLTWTWRKLSSMHQTERKDRPEADVVLSSLVKFDNDTILLVGGLRGEEQRKYMKNESRYGFGQMNAKNEIDVASDNNHLYSISKGTWTRLVHGANVRGWNMGAHNIGEKKVLLLSGQPHFVPQNTLYILSATDRSIEWKKVIESLSGLPPSVAVFRSSVWTASSQSLLLFGGRYMRLAIQDSVYKQRDSDRDLSSICMYDNEFYCFNLDMKQWIRLRIPQGASARHSHTMNAIGNKVVVLGGSRIAEGLKGYEDERDYVTDVLAYDLDFSPLRSSTKKGKDTKSAKNNGKRKGKKKK